MPLQVDNHVCEAQLKKVYEILREISVYIEFYKQLFCKNNNRIEIINESAGTFFVYCRNAIVESIVMRLSKLTDAPTMGRYNNLTITTLLQNIVPTSNPDYSSIKSQIQNLAILLETVREKRNKHLGHLDLDNFSQEYPITLEELCEGVSRLEAIFNAIIRHLPEGLSYSPDTTCFFEPILDFHSDARAALIMLERGRRFKKMVQEMPEECLMPFIPENERRNGRNYFQRDILKYIDAKPEASE
ncbi:AbiU2 domain-containing protein [Vampirovibrio chlorellavorus]|uniref:AbiU2 domain-containing protein n=1 Tax=Vampirovibrio chlorellavorus TaxID=758823 RepID=UPI0026F27D31|nr:hypothetical protein [Vampirovibrio chlorellavorus]